MRAPPQAIARLQRLLEHEFGAARQFALQAAVAERCADDRLARFCTAAASEEIEHAQRLANALLALNAGFGGGAPPHYEVGRTREEILAAAVTTERSALALYGEALRCAGLAPELRELLAALQAEEVAHLDKLQRWPATESADTVHARRRP